MVGLWAFDIVFLTLMLSAFGEVCLSRRSTQFTVFWGKNVQQTRSITFYCCVRHALSLQDEYSDASGSSLHYYRGIVTAFYCSRSSCQQRGPPQKAKTRTLDYTPLLLELLHDTTRRRQFHNIKKKKNNIKSCKTLQPLCGRRTWNVRQGS